MQRESEGDDFEVIAFAVGVSGDGDELHAVVAGQRPRRAAVAGATGADVAGDGGVRGHVATVADGAGVAVKLVSECGGVHGFSDFVVFVINGLDECREKKSQCQQTQGRDTAEDFRGGIRFHDAELTLNLLNRQHKINFFCFW